MPAPGEPDSLDAERPGQPLDRPGQDQPILLSSEEGCRLREPPPECLPLIARLQNLESGTQPCESRCPTSGEGVPEFGYDPVCRLWIAELEPQKITQRLLVLHLEFAGKPLEYLDVMSVFPISAGYEAWRRADQNQTLNLLGVSQREFHCHLPAERPSENHLGRPGEVRMTSPGPSPESRGDLDPNLPAVSGQLPEARLDSRPGERLEQRVEDAPVEPPAMNEE